MDALDELWLHNICKFEPDLAVKMAPLFGRKSFSFKSSAAEQQMLRDIGISGEIAKRFSDPEVFHEVHAIVDYCNDNSIRILTMDSPEYPKRLKNINLPPRILFVKGAPLDIDSYVGISIVGSRRPTDHGKSFARILGKTLANNNITVISGMAEGIDGQAHMGALDAKGKTVAVLAGSVDEIYPKCHERLYYNILANGGTIVSERPPKTPVRRYFYQQRNRIVTGLSCGTIIVEGKNVSGTAISARTAFDDNRDIFAVPGTPMSPQAELPNRLIFEGATIVNNPMTPVDYYKAQYPDLIFEREVPMSSTTSNTKLLSEDDLILDFLKSSGGVARLEDIAENCNISINVLSGRLTILSIKGKIRQESGNKYVLIQ